MFLGKGVDSACFFTGFATGRIDTVTIFTVRPVGRDEELAAVFALFVKDISLSKAEEFIADQSCTEFKS